MAFYFQVFNISKKKFKAIECRYSHILTTIYVVQVPFFIPRIIFIIILFIPLLLWCRGKIHFLKTSSFRLLTSPRVLCPLPDLIWSPPNYFLVVLMFFFRFKAIYSIQWRTSIQFREHYSLVVLSIFFGFMLGPIFP